MGYIDSPRITGVHTDGLKIVNEVIKILETTGVDFKIVLSPIEKGNRIKNLTGEWMVKKENNMILTTLRLTENGAQQDIPIIILGKNTYTKRKKIKKALKNYFPGEFKAP